MQNFLKQINLQKEILYNNILSLCRNSTLYTKIGLNDTFQNRINLIFIHISFIFIKVKKKDNEEIYKIFYQKIFDLIFNKIDLNMREIGFGDSSINTNMRYLIKSFYNILSYCEKYEKMSSVGKYDFLNKFLEFNVHKNNLKNKGIIDYFNKYEAFCLDLSSDSVLKGDFKFNYN